VTARETMHSRRSAALRVGWILVALSAVGLVAAPLAIVTNIQDLSTRVWPTMAPQLLGLVVGATGWVLCMAGMGRHRAS